MYKKKIDGTQAASFAVGELCFHGSVIEAAGAIPVASDLAALVAGTFCFVSGTGNAKYLCWKDADGSFAVEMGSI